MPSHTPSWPHLPPGFSNCKPLVNKEIGHFLPEAVVLVGRGWGELQVQRSQHDLGIRQTEEAVEAWATAGFLFCEMRVVLASLGCRKKTPRTA